METILEHPLTLPLIVSAVIICAFPLLAGYIVLVERKVLADMQVKSSGTILGSGHPPHQVIGFYHLHNAPWVILLYAQGNQILAVL